jgi:amino acid transporter
MHAADDQEQDQPPQPFNRVNSAITWWKVAIPVLAIIVLFTQFRAATSARTADSCLMGSRPCSARSPSAGIIFAYLGFEQADQLAGEVRNPQRKVPLGIIGAVLIGTAIYILLQVVFIGALRPSELAHGWAGLASNAGLGTGPLAFLAGVVALGWLAVILRVDAFISPSGTGLIALTRDLTGRVRASQEPLLPPVFCQGRQARRALVQLDPPFLLGLVFRLPFPS